jgi:glycosyltransferase involved in cell wall biosynthesis
MNSTCGTTSDSESRIISVITPLHEAGNRFIDETYDSLIAQTNNKWEWIIVENNGGRVPPRINIDSRVKVVESTSKSIGMLKRLGFETAQGEILVELDADDTLHETALEKIEDAFATDKSCDFAFSDFAEFIDEPFSATLPFSARYGWSCYPVRFRGIPIFAMRSPEATEHNVRLVDWAPNHVRAWRKKSYWKIGGHDTTLEVGDDHDLIVRMVIAGMKLYRIGECLYFYRIHGENTVKSKNGAIRHTTTQVYNRTLWALAEKWTNDRKLIRLDLCGGIDAPVGYTPIDQYVPTGKGIVCNLDGPWKVKDSSVGILRAHDAIEHLRDPVHMMNEAYRVLAPGGWLMISVPSTNGLGAFCDPTHKSFWNKLSFRYYTDPAFAKYITEFKGKFQVSRVIEWFPSEWHKENNVPYVEAHLISCKDGFRAMGEYLWSEDKQSGALTSSIKLVVPQANTAIPQADATAIPQADTAIPQGH